MNSRAGDTTVPHNPAPATPGLGHLETLALSESSLVELRPLPNGAFRPLLSKLLSALSNLRSRQSTVSFLAHQQTLTMWEPTRQTGFMTTVTLIVGGLMLMLSALLVREAIGQPPAVSDEIPYQIASRRPPHDSGSFPNFGELLEARRHTPHPAVARIVVPEGSVMAYGSGTLVDVRDRYGLVITNWHVVRDATETIEVIFPGGFRSQARALKVDPDWDLAALVIWRPPIEPIALAQHSPRPGDMLTIHGYGQGNYRVATGRCTQYYAPRPNFPQEMVELDVEARQGDSGGPIFNNRGELAGVLFGAGQGTTIGSFGRRVESFLATLAPDIGRGEDATMIASADSTAENERDEKSAIACCPESGSAWQTECCPPAVRADPPWQATAQATLSPSDGTESSSVTSTPESPRLARGRFVAHAKSVLAIIGLLTVCIHIVRVVS